MLWKHSADFKKKSNSTSQKFIKIPMCIKTERISIINETLKGRRSPWSSHTPRSSVAGEGELSPCIDSIFIIEEFEDANENESTPTGMP